MQATVQGHEAVRPAFLLLAGVAALIAGCSGGGGSVPVETVTITGHVLDAGAQGATVCLDADASGRCGAGEPSSRTDAAGDYRLEVPKGSTAALVAEFDAIRTPLGTVASAQPLYRMASPAYTYATAITPFTTLVLLSGERSFALAEDLVRDVLGLPARFGLALDATTPPTSLVRSVADHVTATLKSTEGALDWSAPGALARFAEALPAAITTLPTLAITTKDGAPIVSREDYVDATYVLTNPAASTPTASLAGKIRGRGHSTWGQPKNPYKVQFANDAAYAALPDVLGMKKNRNWALLADYFDRSLMRNKLAFALANSAVFADGLKWNPSGLHVEVTLNGDYVGVYLLTEDIRIDPARLNIRKMSSSASVNDVDGGYIVEADWLLDCYNDGDINLQYVSASGTRFCVDTPDEGSITKNQLAYVKGLLGSASSDLVSGANLSRLNARSFADFYLLSEFLRNNDANFFSSVFLWKDTDAAADPLDRLLNAGPVWDFDISAGNYNQNENWKTAGCWISKQNGANWFPYMFANGDYVGLTLARWQQKRPALERFVNASIDTYVRRLRAAQERNFRRWPILGIQLTNYYQWQTWDDEVAFLRSFLNERMAWLDTAYATPQDFAALCR